jgi:hypothetical protein
MIIQRRSVQGCWNDESCFASQLQDSSSQIFDSCERQDPFLKRQEIAVHVSGQKSEAEKFLCHPDTAGADFLLNCLKSVATHA